MSQSSLFGVDPVKIVDYILPVLLPKLPVARVQSGGSSTAVVGDGSGMVEHDIAGIYHTGTLADAQAPQFLKTDGTRALSGHLTVGAGYTIDGVDISAHASNPEAHHDMVTVEGPLHITGQQVGLTYGEGLDVELLTTLVVRLDGNSGLQFGTLDGLQMGTPTIVGVGSTNSVTTNTHSHAVDYTTAGAANKLLALDVNSRAYAAIFEASYYVRTSIIDTFSTDLTIIPAGDLWVTPNGAIELGSGSNIIRVQPSNDIKSYNYASQTTGWAITYDGAGDFRYLYADEMHVKVFIADLEQALAGGQIISKSVAQLAVTFTAPDAGGAALLYVRDLPSAQGMQVFQDGDIVRLRKFTRSAGSLDVSDCWGTVYFGEFSPGVDASGSTYQLWAFFRSTGSDSGMMASGTTIEPGSLVLDYGTSGNGFYEVNAIDGLNAVNSPYLQFVRWTSHPATGKSVRVRLGQLKGMFGVDEFGMFVGSGTSSTDTYLRLSDYAAGNSMNNLPLTMYASGSKSVVIDPTFGVAVYSSPGSYGNQSNRINFIDSTDLQISGIIAAPHDTNYFRIFAAKGLLELASQYSYGGSPGNLARIVVDGQGASGITLHATSLALQAGPSFVYKQLTMTQTYARIDGYDIWTTATLTNPVTVGGSYSNIGLDYLRTSAIRTGGSLSVLNSAGSGYVRVYAYDYYIAGSTVLAAQNVSLRHTSDTYYVGAIGSLFFSTDGYFMSDTTIKLMNGAANTYQSTALGALQSYVGGPWQGGMYTAANGSGYGYYDYYYNGSRMGYMLWTPAYFGMIADGRYAYITGTRVGIHTTAPAYAFDVSGEGRITGAFRTDVAFSMLPRSAPAASGTYGVLYVNTSGQLRYIRPGGGDYYVAG